MSYINSFFSWILKCALAVFFKEYTLFSCTLLPFKVIVRKAKLTLQKWVPDTTMDGEIDECCLTIRWESWTSLPRLIISLSRLKLVAMRTNTLIARSSLPAYDPLKLFQWLIDPLIAFIFYIVELQVSSIYVYYLDDGINNQKLELSFGKLSLEQPRDADDYRQEGLTKYLGLTTAAIHLVNHGRRLPLVTLSTPLTATFSLNRKAEPRIHLSIRVGKLSIELDEKKCAQLQQIASSWNDKKNKDIMTEQLYQWMMISIDIPQLVIQPPDHETIPFSRLTLQDSLLQCDIKSDSTMDCNILVKDWLSEDERPRMDEQNLYLSYKRFSTPTMVNLNLSKSEEIWNCHIKWQNSTLIIHPNLICSAMSWFQDQSTQPSPEPKPYQQLRLTVQLEDITVIFLENTYDSNANKLALKSKLVIKVTLLEDEPLLVEVDCHHQSLSHYLRDQNEFQAATLQGRAIIKWNLIKDDLTIHTDDFSISLLPANYDAMIGIVRHTLINIGGFEGETPFGGERMHLWNAKPLEKFNLPFLEDPLSASAATTSDLHGYSCGLRKICFKLGNLQVFLRTNTAQLIRAQLHGQLDFSAATMVAKGWLEPHIDNYDITWKPVMEIISNLSDSSGQVRVAVCRKSQLTNVRFEVTGPVEVTVTRSLMANIDTWQQGNCERTKPNSNFPNRTDIKTSTFDACHRPLAINLHNLLPMPFHIESENIPVKDILPGCNISLMDSFLIITIKNYLSQDWWHKVHIEPDGQVDNIWRLHPKNYSSEEDQPILELSLHRNLNSSHNTLNLSIYSPFWLINNTDLPLHSNDGYFSKKIWCHPVNRETPFLYQNKKIRVRVQDSSWSRRLSLKQENRSFLVTCHNTSAKRIYQLSVHLRLSRNNLTTLVIFAPLFIVCNITRYNIQVQTVRRGYPSKKDEKQWAKVSSGKSIGLWPNPYDTCLIFRVKSADGIEETVPISLEQHTDRFLRLGNHYGGLFVSIRNCDTSVIFACYPYKPGRAPLLLVNHSTESVVNFRDADSSKLLELQLGPRRACFFAWPQPDGQRRLVGRCGEHEMSWNISNHLVLRDGCLGAGRWLLFFCGRQRVMLFTEDDGLADRIVAAEQSVRFRILLNLSRISVGLVDRGQPLVNAIFTAPPALKSSREDTYPFIMQSTSHHRHLYVKLHLCIHNCFPNNTYATVLESFCGTSNSSNKDVPPLIEMSIVERLDRHTDVRQLIYVGGVIREFHLRFDMLLLHALADFFTPCHDVIDVSPVFKSVQHDVIFSLQALHHLADKLKDLTAVHCYLGHLSISPITMHVSVSDLLEERNNFEEDNNEHGGEGIAEYILSVIKTRRRLPIKINDAVFDFDTFTLHDLCTTPDDLFRRAHTHYKWQMAEKLYKILQTPKKFHVITKLMEKSIQIPLFPTIAVPNWSYINAKTSSIIMPEEFSSQSLSQLLSKIEKNELPIG